MAWLALAFAAFGLGCRHEPTEDPVAATKAPALSSHETHADQEVHDEHAAHMAAPTLESGQLWATDEPLRAAMQRIRAAVDQAGSAQEKKQFTLKEAQSLAATVEENIAYMVANCKLEAKPDAALHVLIGRMLSAAASLKKESASDGVSQLRAVLHDYQSTFDHPGWSVK